MVVHEKYCSAVTYEMDLCTCGALFRGMRGFRDPAQPCASPAAVKQGDAFAGERCIRARTDLETTDF